MDQLDAPAVQESIAAHKKRVGPLAKKGCEGRVDLTASAGVEHLYLLSHGAGSRFQVSQGGLGIGRICRIDEHGHASGCGHQQTQKFQPLCHQLSTEEIDAREVAAGAGEARDQTEPDWVVAGKENDGNCRSRGFSPQRHTGAAARDDHGDRSASQFGCQRRKSIKLISAQR